ncbi:MAG: double zinc ribbon domain-containing protein [Acidobacteriota bacterium]
MSDDSPRCPRCGKRITGGALACPSCGLEFLPHRRRIRCHQCGRRIPADIPECPHCGGDPYASRFPFRLPSKNVARVTVFLLGILLLACAGWILFRAASTNLIGRVLGLAEPTQAPTQVIQVIYVVATSPAPTATLIPTLAPTATPRFSPTPTRRGARTPTAARATATPVPRIYPAPQLLGPANTTVYTGAAANIVLEWQPISSAGLGENEWYRISISYTGRDGKPVEQIRWSKEVRWTVIADWWSDLAQDTRTVKWNVTVVRSEGIDPFASNNAPASPPSITRIFIWN